MLNKLRKVKKQLFDNKLYYYEQNRTRLGHPLYGMDLYWSIIEQVSRGNFQRPQFNTLQDPKERVNIYCRHDIDTLACMQKMDQMLEIDLEFEQPSSVYFLVNDEHYELKDYKELALKYKDKGIEMGLHTCAYLSDDYLDAFVKETDKFEAALGFRPDSFTVHGHGSFRKEIRKQFQKEVVSKLNEYGYSFTDAGQIMRKYHYVIEDCHYDSKLDKRYIYNDWNEIPSFLKNGNNCLILTHPCYW